MDMKTTCGDGLPSSPEEIAGGSDLPREFGPGRSPGYLRPEWGPARPSARGFFVVREIGPGPSVQPGLLSLR